MVFKHCLPQWKMHHARTGGIEPMKLPTANYNKGSILLLFLALGLFLFFFYSIMAHTALMHVRKNSVPVNEGTMFFCNTLE